MSLHLLHHLVHTVRLLDLFLLPADSLGLSQICMDILKQNCRILNIVLYGFKILCLLLKEE